MRQLRKQREQFLCMRCKGSKASSTTFGSQLNVSNSLKFHFWSSFPPAEGQVSEKDDLAPINLCLLRTDIDVLRGACDQKQASRPQCKHPNYWTGFLLGATETTKGFVSAAVCVWLPLPHTWFVSQSGTAMGGAATSCTKAEMAEGVKREPTDPHKQALSFMASVTPSLLKPDS